VSRNGDQLSVFSSQFSVKNKVQLVLTDNGQRTTDNCRTDAKDAAPVSLKFRVRPAEGTDGIQRSEGPLKLGALQNRQRRRGEA